MDISLTVSSLLTVLTVVMLTSLNLRAHTNFSALP
jgi:hypothetical protein